MSSVKEIIIKQLKPLVIPHILPLEQKAIELLNSIELQENETEIISIIQSKNNELHTFLFAVNSNFDLVRQIEVKKKKSFKIKDLIINALNIV